MRFAHMFLLIIATGYGVAQPAEARLVPSAKLLATFCNLRSGDLFALEKGLNQDDHCAVGVCKFSQTVTIPIADYNSSWLWNGAWKLFTLVEANSFRTDAKSRANMATPVGKKLIRIDYFHDSILFGNSTAWQLGAKATYGVCGGVKNNPKN